MNYPVRLMESRLFNIHGIEQNEYFLDESWTVEKKYDGRRLQLIKNSFGQLHYFSAKGQIFDNFEEKFPHLVKEIKRFDFPKNTLVDGELNTNLGFGHTSSIIRSNPTKSLDLQYESNEFLSFIIFDCVFYNNQEVWQNSLDYRGQILETLLPEDGKYLKLIEQCNKNKKEYYDKIILDIDCEGIVFKLKDSPYQFKSTLLWRKLKKEKVFSAVILGMNEGHNRLSGTCGSLEIGQIKDGKLESITKCDGMTYEERSLFWNNKTKYIGQVIEIKALEKTKKSYRNPRFYRLRPDKDKNDCIF